MTKSRRPWHLLLGAATLTLAMPAFAMQPQSGATGDGDPVAAPPSVPPEDDFFLPDSSARPIPPAARPAPAAPPTPVSPPPTTIAPPDALSPAPVPAPASTQPTPASPPTPVTPPPTAIAPPAALAPAPVPAPVPPPAPAAASAPVPSAPTTNAMANLIRLLVQQGTITQANGQALIAQAETEARVASTALAAAPPAPGSVRVGYVPQVVRDEIRDEIKAELAQTAQSSGALTRDQLPGWINRVALSGDIRFRSQSELYSGSNATGLIDFAAFNRTGPIDINPVIPFSTYPLLNTRRDQWNRLRLRARLGLQATLTEGVSAGVRVATGNDNGPVSTNQILGGGFSKKDIWLDQAYFTLRPTDWAALTFGRSPNPFLSTELLFDDDLNFDGVSVTVGREDMFADNLNVSLVGGAFPLGFGDDDFPSNGFTKPDVDTKWLFSGQVRAEWEFAARSRVRFGAAYHSFANIQGDLSTPCATYQGPFVQCSTDPDRPLFLQKGNTLFRLRQIALDPANPSNASQPQFAGLTFDYDILDLNAEAEIAVGDERSLTISGNYLRNLSYDRSEICRNGEAGAPLNNLGTIGDVGVCTTPGTGETADQFESSGTGWRAAALFGHRSFTRRGNWHVFGGYQRLGPDAVLDSLTDTDFHLGGTNAKGYFIGGSIAAFDNVVLSGRWLSANEVFGPPLAIDVLQIDLSVEF